MWEPWDKLRATFHLEDKVSLPVEGVDRTLQPLQPKRNMRSPVPERLCRRIRTKVVNSVFYILYYFNGLFSIMEDSRLGHDWHEVSLNKHEK